MRMERRGLLCVFMMVLIYNASVSSTHMNNLMKSIDNSSIFEIRIAMNNAEYTGNASIRKIREQTELSIWQTTRIGTEAVTEDRLRFMCKSTGGKGNIEKFDHNTDTSRKILNSTVYSLTGEETQLTNSSQLGDVFYGQNQHGIERINSKEGVFESVPLRFTYRFGLGDNDRLRRHVFGKDNRLHVPSSLTQIFPFSAVVRLGAGCTGTLIWYKHVLTAAHCVHDGNKYRPPIWKLKVGILRRSGTFKWLKVKRIFVANAWIRKEGLKKIAHDYAVLELDKPHGRPYMTFGWHPTKEGRIIQFSGFPADKPVNEIWFSQCSVRKGSKKILYNYCDAYPGMSGSGVYVYDKNMPSWSRAKKTNRKVVAIFSSFVEWRRKDGKVKRAWNTATRLTHKKVERICNWIKAGKGCKLFRRL